MPDTLRTSAANVVEKGHTSLGCSTAAWPSHSLPAARRAPAAATRRRPRPPTSADHDRPRSTTTSTTATTTPAAGRAGVSAHRAAGQPAVGGVPARSGGEGRQPRHQGRDGPPPGRPQPGRRGLRGDRRGQHHPPGGRVPVDHPGPRRARAFGSHDRSDPAQPAQPPAVRVVGRQRVRHRRRPRQPAARLRRGRLPRRPSRRDHSRRAPHNLYLDPALVYAAAPDAGLAARRCSRSASPARRCRPRPSRPAACGSRSAVARPRPSSPTSGTPSPRAGCAARTAPPTSTTPACRWRPANVVILFVGYARARPTSSHPRPSRSAPAWSGCSPTAT